MRVTREQKRTALLREVKLRRRVYGRMISEGQMDRDDAIREIRLMEAIAEDYRPKDLFSEGGSNV